MEKIHTESPDKGYRRINDDLRHDYGIHVNDKRILRICRAKDVKSTIKYSNHGCTRQAKKPQYIAENRLNRQFYAQHPNEKWLTDVTEFKWYEGITVHKHELHGGKFPHLKPDFCPCRITLLPMRFPAEKVLDFTGLLGP